MNNNNRKLLVATLSAFALTGCAAVQSVNQMNGDITQQANAASGIQSQLRAAKPEPAVIFSHDQYITRKPIPIKVSHMPDVFYDTLTFRPPFPIDLDTFGQELTKTISQKRGVHIPVRITPDALEAVANRGKAAGQGGKAGGAAPGMPSAAMMPPLPGMPGGFGGGMAGMTNDNRLDINYQGSLAGLLDTATSKFGLSWRYDQDSRSIVIFYTESKVFNLYVLPRTAASQSVISSGTVSGSSGSSSAITSAAGTSSASATSATGGSGSTLSASETIIGSLWDEIGKTCNSMLVAPTAKCTTSPSTGSIVVNDTPESLARIGKYIDAQNKKLNKQVVVDMRVLSVTLADTNSLGLNWNVVFQTLSKNYGINLANTFDAGSGTVNGTFSVLNTAGGNVAKFAGTQAIIQALASQGNVSTVLNPTMRAMNLQQSQRQYARQISYIGSASTTTTANVGASAQITPASVTDGTTMTILPYIEQDNKEMLLNYQLNVTALLDLVSRSSGGTTIQTPDTDNRIINEQVRVKSGQTIVMSGFDQVQQQSNKSGVGNPDFTLFGGGVNGQRTRTITVILITPVIVGD